MAQSTLLSRASAVPSTSYRPVLPRHVPFARNHVVRLQQRQHHNFARAAGLVARSAAVSQSEGENVVSTTTKELREITKDDFYTFLEEAGDKLVIVDYYTSWCGPCKVIYPKLVEMQETYATKAVFAKFNCNKANKELGQKLGIKVAPTFQLYRNSTKLAELTGAKEAELRELIEKHL